MKKTILLLSIISIAATAASCAKPKVPTYDPVAEAALGTVQIEDINVGTGAEIGKDQKIVIHYKGTLIDGTEFANSYKQGEPLRVLFGNDQLIRGMELGMAGMKIGGVRKLTIPPHLGYGKRGMRNIPPESTLVFEVKLVDILN